MFIHLYIYIYIDIYGLSSMVGVGDGSRFATVEVYIYI